MRRVARPGIARELRLIAIGDLPVGLIEWLRPELERDLTTTARIEPPLDLNEDWRGKGGRHVRSDLIIDALIEHYAPEIGEPVRSWVLAITSVDLRTPERPWVFGEATVGGCCAVVTTASLAPESEPAGQDLLRSRVLKEAIHELGHVAGLGHCVDPACVMAESGDVADVDRKDARFCAVCAVTLGGLR